MLGGNVIGHKYANAWITLGHSEPATWTGTPREMPQEKHMAIHRCWLGPHTEAYMTDDTWNFAALHILRVALNWLFHTFQRLIHYPYKHNWSYWLSAWVTPHVPNSSQIRDRRALWTSSTTSSSQKNCPNSLLRQNSIWTHIHTSKERVSWVLLLRFSAKL